MNFKLIPREQALRRHGTRKSIRRIRIEHMINRLIQDPDHVDDALEIQYDSEQQRAGIIRDVTAINRNHAAMGESIRFSVYRGSFDTVFIIPRQRTTLSRYHNQ